MHLNADVPHFYTLMRKEYLRDLRDGHGEFVNVAVFGVASIPSRAILFHCMTDFGAQIARMPISAFTSKAHPAHLELDVLELWDSFSYEIAVTCYSFLKGLRVKTILRDKSIWTGRYKFTLDWSGSPYSEDPGEGGHKCAHIIELDCGCYAAQPNNRIIWREPSFIVKPFNGDVQILTNNHVWTSEGRGKWVTEDTDKMFYGIKEEL